ncbi:MAG TPA: type II secretion system F family protein [Sulfuricurvum sp.]|nr:type II secretion system F family protein [Sulfuricurvum sp.]
MEFVYKGLSPEGKRIKGTLEAASLEDAKRQLRSQGTIYSSLNVREGSFFDPFGLFGTQSIPSALLIRISRDLAIYLHAGVPLIRALSLQEHQYVKEPKTARFFALLITLLDEGKSLSAALEGQNIYTIPNFYLGTLRASEDRGVLAAVLNELATYIQVGEQIRSQLTKAFIYPGFIIAVSILTVSFMLSSVVPKLSAIFETMGQELPALTQGVLALSSFFSASWHWLLLCVGIVIAMTARALQNRPAFRYRVERLLLSLPVIGRIIQTSDLARFSAIASLLIRSGIPIVKAISLAGATLSSSVLKAQFAYGAERIVEGGRLSASLASGEHVHLDEAFIGALAVGEETSELPTMLESLSNLYMERNRETIALFLSLLEPTLILVVGGVIGIIVTAMLLPIFSLSLG